MEVQIFTLCDYAQNANGKLTIVGTFNRINTNAFPFRYSFSLAVRIAGVSGDGDRHLNVSVRNGSGDVVFQPIDENVTPASIGASGIVAFVVNYEQVEITSAGTYTVTLSFGDFTASQGFEVSGR